MLPELSEQERQALILIAGGSAYQDRIDERDVEEPSIDMGVLASLEGKGLVRVDRNTSGKVRGIAPVGYATAIVEALASEHRSGAPMGDWKAASDK